MSSQLCKLNPKNTLKQRYPCTCHRCQHFFDDDCPEEPWCDQCKGPKAWLLGIAACKNVVPIEGFEKKFVQAKGDFSYFTAKPLAHGKLLEEKVKHEP